MTSSGEVCSPCSRDARSQQACRILSDQLLSSWPGLYTGLQETVGWNWAELTLWGGLKDSCILVLSVLSAPGPEGIWDSGASWVSLIVKVRLLTELVSSLFTTQQRFNHRDLLINVRQFDLTKSPLSYRGGDTCTLYGTEHPEWGLFYWAFIVHLHKKLCYRQQNTYELGSLTKSIVITSMFAELSTSYKHVRSCIISV